ncbi:MAG: FlgD immunoglobulin-like domain containing protein, partial [Nitrososphaera sp.]
IGLYRVGTANTSFLWWQYTQGTPSGYFTPNAPTVSGQYEFRYFLNDGYTETARSNTVTVLAYWTYDTFDALNLGSLHGQNGWATVAGSSSASVVPSPSAAGKVMELKAPLGGKIFMSKSVSAALSGTQSLEMKVRVEQPNGASMVKLEVNTNNGQFWDKKFQIYFGSSMRLNNSPSSAVNFLLQTVPQQWYTVKVVFDLGTNLLDLYLDGVLVLNDVTIGAGAISGIAVTGFSASPNYVLLDDILGYTGGLTKTTNQDVVAESAEIMPSSFDLAQNYPNPFNPETTIQYAIPGHVSGRVKVTLRIFNLQGQVVRTLVDEQKSPGQYRVVWDGKNDLDARIATGVYLYTITAGEFKAAKRMTILK